MAEQARLLSEAVAVFKTRADAPGAMALETVTARNITSGIAWQREDRIQDPQRLAFAG